MEWKISLNDVTQKNYIEERGDSALLEMKNEWNLHDAFIVSEKC